VSLVSNYRSTFSQEVARSGIDGLIKSLEEKTRTSVKG
jgi:phospholipid transport system substrate-binding protein